MALTADVILYLDAPVIVVEESALDLGNHSKVNECFELHVCKEFVADVVQHVL